MSILVVTGSAGLIGSETARFFSDKGLQIHGIDNDMRRYFFGENASTRWCSSALSQDLGSRYRHDDLDIRDLSGLEKIFRYYGTAITGIVHTAAQPSHDWAAREPLTDFTVNANGTLNLLELTRRHCPDASFIFTSTNKVYGDSPNRLPLVEDETRWRLAEGHPYARHGIDESLSIDHCLHSLFGASKVAADILVQEYGRYFDLKTACFRGGCLTGPAHSGAELHGFLAYLMKCVVTGQPYTIFGYRGKQVRDNIHSKDLVNAFWHFFQHPRSGEVYNMGGGPDSNCSMLEAIEMSQRVAGRKLHHDYVESNRTGDHIWWVSDLRKFKSHYPGWELTYRLEEILNEIYQALSERLQDPVAVS
ncbi:MAG: NAD-dependent epimerase/dehydratase family protein [Magnetococcales bacterium]|nr:NAD-dependent epimerase/dehydratase family protein [Magnetococcales bacterium]